MLRIFFLIAAFELKHFLCDYPLQSAYMLKKREASDWVGPLAFHALVHGAGTLVVILLACHGAQAYLAFADAGAHFAIDRLKAFASRNRTPDTRGFWIAHGIDQLAHQLVQLAILWMVI